MTRSGWSAFVTILALTLVAVVAATSRAQGTAARTPNLWTAWSPVRGVVQLNFSHRFEMSDPPLRKLTNTPTFQVATGIVRSLGVGFVYGSNSDLVGAYPNEWEWFARWAPASQDGGAPIDAWLQGGWNIAAESADAELTAARNFGALRLLVAGRAFDHAFYRDSVRYAVVGGAALRLTDRISLAGDYGSLFDRLPGERPVWSAGLNLSVPYTPHSMSLHGGNVGTGTLEGVSRGSRTRWSFEYTVPITLSRFAPRREIAASTPAGPGSGGMADMVAIPTAAGAPDTVVVTIDAARFVPATIEIDEGDVVVWRNSDPIAHTATADAGAFSSPLIDPGKQWSFVFAKAGKYSYHCMPHPFMTGTVHVRGMTR
jgi:plastocyanin